MRTPPSVDRPRHAGQRLGQGAGFVEEGGDGGIGGAGGGVFVDADAKAEIFEGLMPGGLAALSDLGVDPVGHPFCLFPGTV